MIIEHPLVIFDCDGVLIDSEAVYIEIELAYLAKRGVTVERDWYMRRFLALAENLWRQRFSDLIEQATGEPMSDAEYTEFKAHVRGLVIDAMRTIAGIEALLDRLKAPRCVASSTISTFLPTKLARAGLADYFGDGVFAGDMVTNGKPAPDLFELAARTMGHDARACITIEDSPNGVRGAKAAGQYVVGFTGGGHWQDKSGAALREAGADDVVESHAQLAAWLARNTAAMA